MEQLVSELAARLGQEQGFALPRLVGHLIDEQCSEHPEEFIVLTEKQSSQGDNEEWSGAVSHPGLGGEVTGETERSPSSLALNNLAGAESPLDACLGLRDQPASIHSTS